MKILVAGGSIAGMGTALALAGPGREIIVLDRDSAPPDVALNQVFDTWQRKGATQLRHGHGFTSRFLTILRDHHPDLLSALMSAGAREVTFKEGLPSRAQANYRAEPGDEDISVLFCRRTTLEFVMRNYIAKQPGISFVTDARVTNIITEKDPDGIPAAKALAIQKSDETREEMRGDVIIDASGRTSNFRDNLAEQGIIAGFEEKPIGIVYFTRHYRLRPGESVEWSPEGGGLRLDYFQLGIIPGDLNSFVVMAMIPLNERVLRTRILHTDVFDRLCAAIPAIAKNTSRADPASQVLGMGDLKNVWVHWVKDGQPLIKNFFAVGDSAIRTNPAFGRGCSFALLEADSLASALRESNDPLVRAQLYERKIEKTLRGYFDQMVRQDESIIQNAERAHDPAYKASLKDKILKSFAADALAPAMNVDAALRRDIMRGIMMLDPPTAWMKKPGNIVRLLATWAKPKSQKFYAPSFDLDYDRLMDLVGSAKVSP